MLPRTVPRVVRYRPGDASRSAARGAQREPAGRSSDVRIPPATGSTIYGMEKTTLYLPPELKAALKRAAALQGVSEAEIIRQSLRESVGDARPRPRGGLFSGSQSIAWHADELLDGFGDR